MIQKIKDTLSHVTENWRLISLFVLTIWLPGSVLLVYLRLYVFPGMYGGDELRILAQEIRISNIIELAFGPFYVGALLYSADRWKRGLKANYKESMTYAARRSFKLLATRFGTGLIILVGCIALIIPGIILALRFALVDSIVVLDKLEGGKARIQSTQMTEGKRWNILGAVALTYMGILLAVFALEYFKELSASVMGAGTSIHFALLVLAESICSILLSIPVLLLFQYYWEAKAPE